MKSKTEYQDSIKTSYMMRCAEIKRRTYFFDVAEVDPHRIIDQAEETITSYLRYRYPMSEVKRYSVTLLEYDKMRDLQKVDCVYFIGSGKYHIITEINYKYSYVMVCEIRCEDDDNYWR